MHWLDFVLILILGIGALLGLRSGLLWQVARLVILAAAIYGCIHFHDDVGWQLSKHFDGLNTGTARLMSYVVIFLGVLLIGWIITWILEWFLRKAKLKPADRILGALIGILKAGLLSGGVLTGVALYGSRDTQDSLAGSYIAPPMLECMRWVLAAVPQKVKDDLGEALDRIKKTAAEKARQAERDSGEERGRPAERSGREQQPVPKSAPGPTRRGTGTGTGRPPQQPSWGPFAPKRTS